MNLLAVALAAAIPAFAQRVVSPVAGEGPLAVPAVTLPQDSTGLSAAPETETLSLGDTLIQRSLAVPAAETAAAIRSKSLHETAEKLTQLGILKKGEADLGTMDGQARMKYALHRLWDRVGSAVPGEHPVDASLPVPAVVVEREGVEYHLHVVEHGSFFGGLPMPARAGRVRRLVTELRRQDAPLFSEQRFPSLFGYGYGREFMDHQLQDGGATELRPASGPGHLARGVKAVLLLGGGAAAASWAAIDPANILAWATAAAVGAVNYAAWTGFHPLHRWAWLRRAGAAMELGEVDMARHFRAVAEARFGKNAGPAAIARILLPMPLRAALNPDTWARSKAIADRAIAEASASRAQKVHLLVGTNHAEEIAWRLSETSKP